MSHKSRLRRIDAGVRWLETEGVFIGIEAMIKIEEIRRGIDEQRARNRSIAAQEKKVLSPAPKPVAVPNAPPLKVVEARPPPLPPPTPPPRPPECLPGQPVSLPPPDMEIRPTQWRARGAQDYYEDEPPGTNGRCLTEYDVLRDEDDDDE